LINTKEIIIIIVYNYILEKMNKNKKLVGGQIVGIGSDFLVIHKDGKRFLIEVNFESLNEP
jgi:hypothetical protein